MISIIICSRSKTISKELNENIKTTLGSDYELIIIDNSLNQLSIFEAYNKGIYISKGEYLCFFHDDILIHTIGWGSIIHRIFENPSIGLIGVAGSKIKSKMPSTWSECGESNKVINLIQHDKSGKIELKNIGFFNNHQYESVVVIDGVFMVARKNKDIFFNEHLKGFHNYDLNLSYEYLKHDYKIIISNEILIEHFSIGTINKSWYNSSLILFSIYKNILPLTSEKNMKLIEEVKNREVINGAAFVMQLFDHGFYINSFIFWIKLIKLKPFSVYHFIIFKSIFKSATT